MEHYYVVTGNEYGINPSSKKNFKSTELDLATKHYESVLEDDFYAGLKHVDNNGKETIIKEKIDE